MAVTQKVKQSPNSGLCWWYIFHNVRWWQRGNVLGAHIYINEDCWCISTSNLYVQLKPQYPVNKCCHLSLVTVSALGYTCAWLNHMQGSAINCQVSSPLYSIHPSIHSLSYAFCESGYSNRLSMVFQKSLSPATLFSSSWGILRQFHLRDPEVPSGQIWYISPPASSGCTTESPPGCMCLIALQREAVGRHPD